MSRKKIESRYDRAIKYLPFSNDDERLLFAIYATKKKLKVSTFQILCSLLSIKQKNTNILKHILPLQTPRNLNITTLEIAQTLKEYYHDKHAIKETLIHRKKLADPRAKDFIQPTEINEYLDTFFKSFK